MWFRIILGHMEIPPCLCSCLFPLYFFLMLSSFLSIFLCTVDMVHRGYPHLVRASLLCSLSFPLSSSSVTSVLHMSSNVRISPIFWCNIWCGEKKLGIGLYDYSSGRLVVSPSPIPSSLAMCPKWYRSFCFFFMCEFHVVCLVHCV